MADAVRIADRQHEIADLEPIGVSHPDANEVFGSDLDDGDVGFRVGTDRASCQTLAIGEDHHDLIRAVDDVTAGNNQSLFGVDDHAGSRRVDVPISRGHGRFEGMLKERIVHHREFLIRHSSTDCDAHNAWGHSFEQRREARHPLAFAERDGNLSRGIRCGCPARRQHGGSQQTTDIAHGVTSVSDWNGRTSWRIVMVTRCRKTGFGEIQGLYVGATTPVNVR